MRQTNNATFTQRSLKQKPLQLLTVLPLSVKVWPVLCCQQCHLQMQHVSVTLLWLLSAGLHDLQQILEQHPVATASRIWRKLSVSDNKRHLINATKSRQIMLAKLTKNTAHWQHEWVWNKFLILLPIKGMEGKISCCSCLLSSKPPPWLIKWCHKSCC